MHSSHLTAFVLVLLTLLPVVACGHNLATDEGVVDAVNDLLGWEMDQEYACIQRPEAFPTVIVFAAFAADLGCEMFGVFVDEEFTLEVDAASGVVLSELGWNDASSQQKEEWALQWVENVIYWYGGDVLSTPTEVFAALDTPDFAPPSTRSDEEGGVYVSFWVRDPPAMLPEASYGRIEIYFAPSGVVETRTRHEEFTVQFD